MVTMQKIAILGPPGCGKTTLGRAVAAKIGGAAIDLDDFYWEPNWKSVSDEVFAARLEKAMEAPRWVTSGNYSQVQQHYLSKADTIIWLDFAFPLVFGRLAKRTFGLVIRREMCCNGNYESLRLIFSRESIFLWLFKSFKRRRRQCAQIFAAPENTGQQKLRFSRPQEVTQWLQTLS